MSELDPLALISEFVAIPGPPGQEEAVAAKITEYAQKLGYSPSGDAKGNVLIPLGDERPKVVVTAHMDEIAMIVLSVEASGALRVGALGGLFAWKLGEGPVDVLASNRPIPGVLSFGSIHTADSRSATRAAANGAGVDWDLARVRTGFTRDELLAKGVRPGTRVVVGASRRGVLKLNDLIGAHFLDDRADLVSMLIALEALQGFKGSALFVASASEEVGGEGALFAMQNLRPDVCIALELGPNVEDAPVEITAQPTVWVTDSYSTMAAADLELVQEIGQELGLSLQFQALSRGGSDASCAASHGLCARPITLGLPMLNSHGFEIMHPQAMVELARLTEALVRRLA